MSLFTGILQSQAPPKQDATSTIQTLCLRLSTSTLLEDRRAAIQGLRSFAREYKETVASGGLRGLIGTLSKDAEDVDTIKVVLETLLLLFVKDESNVSYHRHLPPFCSRKTWQQSCARVRSWWREKLRAESRTFSGSSHMTDDFI